jgi:hypothetical protein
MPVFFLISVREKRSSEETQEMRSKKYTRAKRYTRSKSLRVRGKGVRRRSLPRKNSMGKFRGTRVAGVTGVIVEDDEGNVKDYTENPGTTDTLLVYNVPPEYITQTLIPNFSSYTNLQYLSIRDVSIGDSAIDSIARAIDAGKLPRLEVLKLENVDCSTEGMGVLKNMKRQGLQVFLKSNLIGPV